MCLCFSHHPFLASPSLPSLPPTQSLSSNILHIYFSFSGPLFVFRALPCLISSHLFLSLSFPFLFFFLSFFLSFFLFIFMHLADAFIESDLQCIQSITFFHQYVCSFGIEPTTFCAAVPNAEPQEHDHDMIYVCALYIIIIQYILCTTNNINNNILYKYINK